MTIDNSIDKDLKKVVTWQYDNAERLVSTIGMFRDFFSKSTTDLWDSISAGVDITKPNEATDFSLAYWGKILGVRRPVITVNESKTTLLSEAYRRILAARFRLLNSTGSTDDYIAFLDYIFEGAVNLSSGDDMAMTFEYVGAVPTEANTVEYHLYAIFEQFPDLVFLYPAGVRSSEYSDSPVIGFAEQVRIIKDGEEVGILGNTEVVLEITNISSAEVNISGSSYFEYNGIRFVNDEGMNLALGETKNMTYTPESAGEHIPVGTTVIVGTEEVSFEGLLSCTVIGHRVPQTEIGTVESPLVFVANAPDFNLETLSNGSIAWKR